jgi:hypothetical protein
MDVDDLVKKAVAAGGQHAMDRRTMASRTPGARDAGHFFPEEIPAVTADGLARFFAVEGTRG